jgi:hypothetical protein
MRATSTTLLVYPKLKQGEGYGFSFRSIRPGAPPSCDLGIKFGQDLWHLLFQPITQRHAAGAFHQRRPRPQFTVHGPDDCLQIFRQGFTPQ